MISRRNQVIADLLPFFKLRWNAGVNNYMVYVTGDVPVGAYNPSRLSNIGIGRGTVDGGFGYTYLNPQTGHEFSGVLGFTYNADVMTARVEIVLVFGKGRCEPPQPTARPVRMSR